MGFLNDLLRTTAKAKLALLLVLAICLPGAEHAVAQAEKPRLKLPFAKPEAEAADFVERFYAELSLPAAQLPPLVRSYYADKVYRFGGMTNLSSILSDTLSYAERWPERGYDVVPGSADATCTALACTVTVHVSWMARSPERNQSANGLALREFVLSRANGGFRIQSEDGKVLARD